MSKVYALRFVQQIPVSIEQAWDYFSAPQNLVEITPPSFGFVIRSKQHESKIYAGQIIEYTVKPLLGIPLYWMTEITHVEPLTYFVDEQRYGPYSLWHHQHHFKALPNGIEMTDIVHYKIPFWIVGDLANELVVKKKLQEVFEFRRKKIEEVMGAFQDRKL